MKTQNYINQKKNLYHNVLLYLGDECDIRDIETIILCFKFIQLFEQKSEFEQLLKLISKISKNHHRRNNFNAKIDLFFQYLGNAIKKEFSNTEIFNIFKNNKKILLYLFENKIITIDKYIFNYILSQVDKKYFNFFLPEIIETVPNIDIKQYEYEIPYLSIQSQKKGR